jgi:hypothetical protein
MTFAPRAIIKDGIQAMWPAFLVLAANTLLAAGGEFTFITGPAALWKVPVRYLRLSLILALPLFLLPLFSTAMRGILRRGGRELVATTDRDTAITAVKSYVIRPIQGIGVTLLLGSKLLSFLQGFAAIPAGVATVLPPPQFAPGRLLVLSAIVASVSLLLSYLWAVDDLGVRHRNNRTGEIKMVGKYLGVLLPTLFGFSGFFSLLQDEPWPVAAGHVMQMAIVFYPPFLTLAVCHALYLQRRSGMLLGKITGGSGNSPSANAAVR